MKERKEVFYSDLSALAIGNIEDAYLGEKWLKVSYETTDYKGNALVASERVYPGALTLKLNVQGWYKIYLTLAEVGGTTGIEVSLSKEKKKTFVRPSHLGWVDGTFSWSPFDFAEEVFYKAADLTGQNLIINKPVYGMQYKAALFAVRLVPMTETEIEEYKNPKNSGRMAYHFDCDYFTECDFEEPSDILGRFDMLHGSNGDLFIHETSAYDTDFAAKVPGNLRAETAKKRILLEEKYKEVGKELKEKAHSYGMKILSGCRIGGGNYIWPATHILDNSYVIGGENCRLQTREGRFLSAGSYAYEAVREAMIERIIKQTPVEWDGVSIFLKRGILVGFEKPICDYVAEKYGVDAKRLPYGDPRLTEALCLPMTQFIKALRERLDVLATENCRGRYALNVVALFEVDNCKEFGYDVEEWAKEGYIDSICQGLMGYKENVEDLLADDGLIDLEKYKEAQKTRHVFTRYYDAKKDIIVGALPQWLEISKKYGVDFYATMPWEHPPYNEQIAMAKALYEAGAEKLFSWNTNHSAQRPATIQAIKDCGDKELITKQEMKEYRKVIRLYSFGGNDVSTFCVNWMG